VNDHLQTVKVRLYRKQMVTAARLPRTVLTCCPLSSSLAASLTEHNNKCTLERQSIKSSLNLFTFNSKLLKWLTNSPAAKHYSCGVEITLLAAKLPPENHFNCVPERHKMASHWSTAHKQLQSVNFGVTWPSGSPSTNRECAGLLCIVIFIHREIAYHAVQPL